MAIPSLTLKERTSIEQKIMQQMDQEMAIIVLVSGNVRKNHERYAYALMTPTQYFNFKIAELSGPYNLMDYGTIIAHGDGLEPPASVKEEMARKYATSDNYIKNLEALIQQELSRPQ